MEGNVGEKGTKNGPWMQNFKSNYMVFSFSHTLLIVL